MEGSCFDRWKVLLWLDEILFKKKKFDFEKLFVGRKFDEKYVRRII